MFNTAFVCCSRTCGRCSLCGGGGAGLHLSCAQVHDVATAVVGAGARGVDIRRRCVWWVCVQFGRLLADISAPSTVTAAVAPAVEGSASVLFQQAVRWNAGAASASRTKMGFEAFLRAMHSLAEQVCGVRPCRGDVVPDVTACMLCVRAVVWKCARSAPDASSARAVNCSG